MRVAVIIPTYNEKENIIPLIHELTRISRINKLNSAIFVVDDNSPDGTGDAVAELRIKNSELRNKLHIIHRPKKEGLGKAYLEGFRTALKNGADFIITMDADFSHNPKDIPRLLKKAKKYDVVVGSRYVDGGEMTGFDFFRRFISKGSISLARLLLGLRTKDLTAGFKCYSRRFIKSLNSNEIASSGYAFQVEVIKKVEKNNFSIIEIPIMFTPRKFGQSKLSWKEVLNSTWALIKVTWNNK